MERLKVYCRDVCRGEATLEQSEGRVEVYVTMDDPADGLYRAVLVGERGELVLGVLEPQKGMLTLRRRPYRRDVERLGELRGVQASCSFSFRRKSVWQRTDQPAELVRSEFLKERLKLISCAWWRREGERLVLALPLEKSSPFPLESLFCFGKIECVEGRRCVVYTFDGRDLPL